MLPQTLRPTTFESINFNGSSIDVPKCIITFDKWKGHPLKETFGGKPVIDLDGKPMFAELAIMSLFNADGWLARWVETYGRKEPIMLTEWKDDKYKNQSHQPFQNKKIISLLSEIAKTNSNTYSGCWDVLALKNDLIIFAESKRSNKDNIRNSQVNWLAAGLKCGLSKDNFLLVQWDFK